MSNDKERAAMKEMTLEEIKRCTLDILLYVDDFCKKNNITYWLAGGTLLGALRHKGFIPWDDDIDIMLPRKDYDRFCQLFPKKGRYMICLPFSPENYPYCWGKVIDSSTLKTEKGLRKGSYTIGVDIDVFPIDNLPNDLRQCERYYKQIKTSYLIHSYMKTTYGKCRNAAVTIARDGIIFALRLLEFLHIINIDSRLRKFLDLAQKYNNDNTDYCGITTIAHYGVKERNPKSNYTSSIEVPFEGYSFPAPNGYHEYLSQLYGENYMQLPPEEKRKTHHSYSAYWKES